MDNSRGEIIVYYRFKCGTFIKAKSFKEAKKKFIKKIKDELEYENKWHECTCLGFSHRYGCHMINKEEVPF